MRNKKRGELAVSGFESVKELEKVGKREVSRLYLTKDVAHLFGGLMKKMAQEKKPYNLVSEEELFKLSGTYHHGGVVAFTPFPREEAFSSSVLEKLAKNREHAVIIDGVGNTNNFGAIVRSAVFFGIYTVILRESEREIAFTSSAFRVSKGAMEHISIYFVKSLERALEEMRRTHFVAATSLQAKVSIKEIKTLCASKPCALILGNEEEGVSEISLKESSASFVIKGKSRMQSLNVAQSASVCFYELTRE